MAPALGVLEAASVATVTDDPSRPAALTTVPPQASAASRSPEGLCNNCTAPDGGTAGRMEADRPRGGAPDGVSEREERRCPGGDPGDCLADEELGTRGGLGEVEMRGDGVEDGGPEEAEIRAAARSFETLVGGGQWGSPWDPLGPGAHCGARVLWQQRAFTWASSALAAQAAEVLSYALNFSPSCTFSLPLPTSPPL
jgi:hypothetical protein